MTLRAIVLRITLVLFGIAAAGCGSGSAPNTGAAGEPAATPGGAAPSAARPVIGAVLMQQDQFFRLNGQGMQQAADRMGADLKVQNATGALDKEASIVDVFVTQNVGAILVSPLDAKGSVPALQRAHERGIKVVTYNNALGAEFPASDIESDQSSLGTSSGRAAREYIVAKLGGKARVALIGFASQLPEQGGARQNGFKEAIADLPGVTIVAEQDAWNAPEAATTVGAILAKKPDVVWAANEGGTVGAVNAVRTAGMAGKVVVFGTDVSVQLLDFLLSEDGILQAVTAQKPIQMGEAAVTAALGAMRGEAVEKRVVLEGELFRRDNPEPVRAFRESLLQAAP